MRYRLWDIVEDNGTIILTVSFMAFLFPETVGTPLDKGLTAKLYRSLKAFENEIIVVMYGAPFVKKYYVCPFYV